MAIIVTNHAIERYKLKVGPRNASPPQIIRAIRRIIAKGEQVRNIDHYFTAYYFLAGPDYRDGFFKVITTRNGRDCVVVTILSPRETEHGYAGRLYNMRKRQYRQMRALRQSLEIQETTVPYASRSQIEEEGG